MDDAQDHADRSGVIGFFMVLSPQIEGCSGVQPDAKADGYGIDQNLQRINQRKGSHGIFADFSNKVAVDNVIK